MFVLYLRTTLLNIKEMTTQNTPKVNLNDFLAELAEANKRGSDLLDSIEIANNQKLVSITSVLDEKRVKYEVNKNNSIGIMLTPFCWTWIDIVGGIAFLSHTYSQNTGKVKKGLNHRVIKLAHLKRLGITL